MVRRVSETLSAIVAPTSKGRSVAALFVGLAGDAPRTPPARISLRGIDRIDLGRAERRAITRIRDQGADAITVALADARMSSQHARLTRVGGAWILEDLGSKNGTWIGAARIQRQALTDGDAILVGHTVLVFRTSGGEDSDVDGSPASRAPGLATLSASLEARFAELASAAKNPVCIEITGESGTGKELVARAVHVLSGRRGAFVPVNCGALPGTLLEGELFGHKKGAYTGAGDERAGLVRSADGGTLFLDEVGELPPSSQAALLRVLQEGEVTPLGSDRTIKVDIRLVTATHRNLDADVAANRFRADLRARMLGVTIELPSLRDRREDLGHLVATLLDRLAPGRTVAFAADAVAALYAYDWPLNIRELERALAAALAVAGDRIELAHLPVSVRTPGAARRLSSSTPPPSPAPSADAALGLDDDDRLRQTLVDSIARHEGNLAAVSRELGKDRTQIRRWMKRFGLARDED